VFVRGIYLISVWLHLLAAMTWVGGMVLFVLALLPFYRTRPDSEKAALLTNFGHRFRAITWVCFSILALTGPLNLWMRGVRPDDLMRPEWRGSPFGQLVLLKLAFVLVAIVLSAFHECASTPLRARWSGRLTLITALAIVWIAVLLVRSA
jgi:uncharacterized membrane protein